MPPPELELLDFKRRVHALYARVREEPITRAPSRRGSPGATSCSPTTRSRRCRPSAAPGSRASRTSRTTPPGAWRPRSRRPSPASTTSPPAPARRCPSRASRSPASRSAATPCELELYWLTAYGGGLFVPFADATAGEETYGAGRYLLDTVKGADLGTSDGRLVLDFNLAYNPSCSYDPRWSCPLAPPPNRLKLPVRMGERHVEPAA